MTACCPSSVWAKIVPARLRMPLHTTDALILRTYKLGESDRIVVFLTRDRGKKRGVAKNARQSRRRFGGGLEPMTCGRVAYVGRGRPGAVRRARARGPRAAQLRRADAITAGGGRWRRAWLRRVLCRADRRVGAGSRSERDAVPARCVDGRSDGGRRPDQSTGAVFRVLAVADAGRLPARRSSVGRSEGVSG